MLNKNAEPPIAVTVFPPISEGITAFAELPVYFVIVTLPDETVYSNPLAVVAAETVNDVSSIPV